MNDFQKPSSPFSDSPKKRKEMAKEADPLQDPFLEPLLPLEESSEHPEGGMMLTPLTPLTPEEDTSFLEASQESRVESWGKTEVRSSQEERTPVVDFEALQVQIEENKGLSRPKDQRDQRMLLPLEAEDSLDMSEKEELLNKGAMESQKISEYKKERKTTAVDFEALLEKSKEGEGFLARGDRTTVMDFQKMQEKVPLEKPVDLPSAVFQGIQNLQVDQYFITKEPLGEGAEAQVFLAYETEEREVPVGVLKLAKPGHENQLYKEIQIAKQFINGELEHENIVRFIKSGVTPRGLPFLVTEYLSPYPQERWTLEEAFSVTAKLATAVTYLHKNRIYHRDIKPANIKFIQKGQQIIPKLFDFGVATNQINEAQNAACSPYYAAPEMLLRLLGLSSEEPQFSKADVFSIAMTLLGFLNFNPYLSIEPDFEHRYKDPLSLTERLIKLQQKDPYLLNEHIEIYLKTNHQWTPEVEERCGIPEAKHQEFLEKTISLLQKSLAIKKEERPICSALVKQMSTLFEEVLGGTIENFLESGCFLFLSEKAAPQDSEQASTVPSLPSDGDPSPKIQERLEKLETYWNSALASNQNSKAIAFGQEILQLEPNRKDIQKQLSKLQKIQTVSAASLRLFKFFSFLFLLFILSGVVYNGFAFRYASELNRNFEKLLAPQPFLANLQKKYEEWKLQPDPLSKEDLLRFYQEKENFQKENPLKTLPQLAEKVKEFPYSFPMGTLRVNTEQLERQALQQKEITEALEILYQVKLKTFFDSIDSRVTTLKEELNVESYQKVVPLLKEGLDLAPTSSKSEDRKKHFEASIKYSEEAIQTLFEKEKKSAEKQKILEAEAQKILQDMDQALLTKDYEKAFKLSKTISARSELSSLSLCEDVQVPLVLETTPSKVEVWLNGESYGAVKVLLFPLKNQLLNLEFRKEGYASKKIQMVKNDLPSPFLEVKLERHLLWNYSLGSDSLKIPFLTFQDKMYLVTRKNTFLMIHLSSQEKKWEIPFPEDQDYRFLPPFLVSETQAFIATAYTLFSVHLKEKGGELKKILSFRKSLSTGLTALHSDLFCVASSNQLYFISTQGKVVLDLKVAAGIEYPPTLAQSSLYFGDEEGGYYEISEAQILEWIEQKSPIVLKPKWKFLKSKLIQSPLIEEDRHYLLCYPSTLYCIQIKENRHKIHWTATLEDRLQGKLVLGKEYCFGNMKQQLLFIDKKNGAFTIPYKSLILQQDPLAFESKILFFDESGTLFCMDPQHKEFLWNIALARKLLFAPQLYDHKALIFPSTEATLEAVLVD